MLGVLPFRLLKGQLQINAQLNIRVSRVLHVYKLSSRDASTFEISFPVKFSTIKDLLKDA